MDNQFAISSLPNKKATSGNPVGKGRYINVTDFPKKIPPK